MERVAEDLLNENLSQALAAREQAAQLAQELTTVIDSAVETVCPLLQTARLRLRVELPPEAIWLEGDPIRLSQIFGNLLNNAIKYTAAGQEIRIVARPGRGQGVGPRHRGGHPCGDPPARVRSLCPGPSVPDADPGRARDRIDAGAEARRAAWRSRRGLQCRPGSGQRDQVCLPLAAGGIRESGKPSRMSGGGVPASTGPRILVVDDNRDAAASLARLLELKGAEVRVAYDGRSALTALEEDPAEVVILDIGMPDLDGHEVARRIRARADWGRTRLIAMTGLGEAADRQRSLEAGFDQHLVKPVPFEVLDGVLAPPPGDTARAQPAPRRTGPLGRPAAVAPDIMPIDVGRGIEGSLAASLVHDLAQPLSSAGCFAAAARTLASQSSAQTRPAKGDRHEHRTRRLHRR